MSGETVYFVTNPASTKLTIVDSYVLAYKSGEPYFTPGGNLVHCSGSLIEPEAKDQIAILLGNFHQYATAKAFRDGELKMVRGCVVFEFTPHAAPESPAEKNVLPTSYDDGGRPVEPLPSPATFAEFADAIVAKCDAGEPLSDANINILNDVVEPALGKRSDASVVPPPKLAGGPIGPLRDEKIREIFEAFGDEARCETVGYPPAAVHSFETGAVRGTDLAALRYDLISPIGLKALAAAYGEGVAKYGELNCEKGMPVTDLLNHAINHIFMFLSGDRSEDHLGHAMWNVCMAIHSHTLWPSLNADKLRRPGCLHPTHTESDKYAGEKHPEKQ